MRRFVEKASLMSPRRIVLAFPLCLAAALIPAAAHAQSRFSFDTTPGSLPKDVVPSEYRLALDLDPARTTFDGAVDIAVKVRRPVDAIVLNAFELTALGASLDGAADVRSMAVTADEAKRQWRLSDGHAIEPGEYRLRILYSGHVHAYGDGLYRTEYVDEGKPARMLATQLEPIAARTVFPGFDEPSFRARFSLKVVAPSGYEVVSNMPVRERIDQGGTTRWQFDATPPMATYLVTVSVGQFDALEDNVDGIPLRILTAKGKKHEALYAMASTKQLMSYYREYFGVPFTLPKLDQLAIPGTRGGAMEDWGAISYVESVLLYDPKTSSIRTKRAVYEVIAHEVSHQWFGDLVTAASWSEIWLNEAFATWMERRATDRFNPDWQVPLQDFLDRQRVMVHDAGTATRAIRSGPVLETAVFDVFDGVTYQKGGAVLDMIETYIGQEAFRRGLHDYFEDRKFSNATASDLWYHLGRASGKDIAAIAQSWTDQEGHPLLDARMTCSDGVRTLTVEQQRFTNAAAIATNERALWDVPFAVYGAGAEPTRILFARRKQDFAVGACGATPAYIDSYTAFFRVRYPADERRELARAFADLPATERMALLADTLALADSGRLPLADYLNLAARVQPANDPATQLLYAQIADALAALDYALAGAPAREQLRAFGRDTLRPMLARLGWSAAPNDGAVTLDLRNTLIRTLGRFHDEETLRKSAELFAADRKGTPVEPTIRPAVMANVARRADRETFDELVRRAVSARGVEERAMYASALGNVEDPALARALLELSLGDTLPPETASSLPRYVAQGGVHGGLAYAFTRDHFSALAAKQSEWGRAFLLPGAAGSFNDAAQATALLADARRLVGKPGERLAREAAGDIELRSRVKSRNAASLGIEARTMKQ